MMTAAIENRKRSREDDSCESTPLSKRINNLHINNFEDSHFQQQSSSSNEAFYNNESQHAPHTHQPPNLETNRLQPESYRNDGLINNGHSNGADAGLLEGAYCPELSQYDNPYYYNKNKLLYELHAERMRRSQQEQDL